MAKQQIAFFCKNCGYSSPKWMGKCNSCGQWNTFVEEVIVKEKNERTDWKENSNGKNPPQKLPFLPKLNRVTNNVWLPTTMS